MVLVRESYTQGHLLQGEIVVLLQELPGPFDAARDDELVRR